MSGAKVNGEKPLIERALAKAAQDPELPSMGRAASILAGVDEDRQSIDSLCEIALSDPGLAQKIARAASGALAPSEQKQRGFTMSKAIVALGIEQVRSLALSMKPLDLESARSVDAGRARRAVGEALQACFCARVVAKSQGMDKDAWGLRALLLGSLPFFLELYDSILAAKLSLACAQNQLPWGKNLITMCGLSETELLDRFMVAWRFPPEARRVPEGDALMAQWALASARALALPDAQAGALALGKAFLPWNENERLRAAEGLAKGTGAGSWCGAPYAGGLNRQEAPHLGPGRGWQDAGERWAQQAEEALQAAREAARAQAQAERDARQAAMEEKAAERAAQMAAKVALSGVARPQEEPDPFAQAISELSQMMGARSARAEVASKGMKALAAALGMELAVCAYGEERSSSAIALAWAGCEGAWAKNFVEAKNRGGMADIFGYAIARGVDTYTWEAKEGAKIPPELSREGEAAPKSFALISLTVKGRPRGYVVLADASPKPKPTARLMERARSFCDRLAWALASAPEGM